MLLRDQSSDNSLKPNYSRDYVILNDLFRFDMAVCQKSIWMNQYNIAYK